MVGNDKFYTIPFSENARDRIGMDGIIVPASSESSAERLAEIHSGNMSPEPPSLKKSETHVATALEITNSTMLKGMEADYFMADERIE